MYILEFMHSSIRMSFIKVKNYGSIKNILLLLTYNVVLICISKKYIEGMGTIVVEYV